MRRRKVVFVLLSSVSRAFINKTLDKYARMHEILDSIENDIKMNRFGPIETTNKIRFVNNFSLLTLRFDYWFLI